MKKAATKRVGRKPRAPGRPKDMLHLELREQILNSIPGIVFREGLDGLFYSNIARANHITPALVRYYFPNLSELMKEASDAVNRGYVSWILRAESETKNPSQHLKNYIKAVFEWAKNNPEQASLFLARYYRHGVRPRPLGRAI